MTKKSDQTVILLPTQERSKTGLVKQPSQDPYWPYKLHVVEIIIWLTLILEIVWPALFLLAHLDLGHAGPLTLLTNQMTPAVTSSILQLKRERLKEDPDHLHQTKRQARAVREALQWIEMEALNGSRLILSKGRVSSMVVNDLSKYLQTPDTVHPVDLNLTTIYRILLYANHLMEHETLSITLMVRVPIIILILVAVFQIPLLLTVEHVRHQRGMNLFVVLKPTT